jgi:hypothetical protein
MNKPCVQAKLCQHEPVVFERAMEMYWSGMDSAAIARKLDIPAGIMYSWAYDFGGERERTQPVIYFDEETPHSWSPKECFRQAENAKEWLEILQKSAQNEVPSENERLRLVCGKIHGQSAARLSMVIYEKLKADSLGGETFAFRKRSNKCGNIITTISWNDSIYHIARYIKTHGTFIWPDEKLGQSIEATRTEFEHLIARRKSLRRKP